MANNITWLSADEVLAQKRFYFQPIGLAENERGRYAASASMEGHEGDGRGQVPRMASPPMSVKSSNSDDNTRAGMGFQPFEGWFGPVRKMGLVSNVNPCDPPFCIPRGPRPQTLDHG